MVTSQFNDKIIDPAELPAVIKKLKYEKKRIVSLNGSFDLMHAGHLYILYEAKKQGDVLVVALNSDDSIKKYKSIQRPIISLSDRMKMMAAIEVVDFVTYFHETEPSEILRKIRPDVHVNGAEYGLDCIESKTIKELGAALHLVERLPALSTSEIIKKIKSLCD